MLQKFEKKGLLTGKRFAAVARSNNAWLCVCGLSDDLIHWIMSSTSNWSSGTRPVMKKGKVFKPKGIHSGYYNAVISKILKTTDP